AGRVGRVNFPARIRQAVVGAPMIGIHAVEFRSGPILDRDWHVRRRKLLPELRREGIEFWSVIVRDDSGGVGGDVGGAEDVELRQRRHLFLQVDFLAVAQRPCRPSDGRYFLGLREDAHEVRHDTLLAYARPELLYASRITLVSRR